MKSVELKSMGGRSATQRQGFSKEMTNAKVHDALKEDSLTMASVELRLSTLTLAARLQLTSIVLTCAGLC